MAISKLINLFVLSSIAVLLCTVDAVPAAALAHGNRMVKEVRHAAIVDSVKKSKRDNQRCKPRETQSQSDSQPLASFPSPSSSPSSSILATASQDPSPFPSPSPSPPGPPSSLPSSVSPFGNTKLGLAWGADARMLDVVMNANPGIGFVYNWRPDPDPEFSQYKLNFVPMLHSDHPDKVAAFQEVVKPGYARFAAAFNEFNEGAQANMSASSMISAWNKYLVPLRSQGYRLIAPVSSSNRNGEEIFQQFLNGIDRSTISFCAIHYYGTTGQGMIDYIEQWLKICDGIQLAITEYSCQNYNPEYENNGRQCSLQQTFDFYKTVIDYVNSNDRIVVHCPFGFFRYMPDGVNDFNRLIDDTKLTDLGSMIVTGSI